VIALECDHFQGATLCKLLWEYGEVAVREEGDLEFVKT